MRVLLVDDEAAFVRPLAERLDLRGIEAGVALDAEAALVMVAEGEWDLVFLDVGLPGMDGVALLKILRERHPDLDVVMLSGAADMGKAVQAMRRGARTWRGGRGNRRKRTMQRRRSHTARGGRQLFPRPRPSVNTPQARAKSVAAAPCARLYTGG